MTGVTQPDHRDRGTDFARAAEQRPPGFLSEFWRFLRNNRKWWLTPIIVTLLIVAVLVLLASTAVGPLIYTVF